MSRRVPRILGCLTVTLTAVGVGQDSGPQSQEPALEQRREFSVPYTNRVRDASINANCSFHTTVVVVVMAHSSLWIWKLTNKSK